MLALSDGHARCAGQDRGNVLARLRGADISSPQRGTLARTITHHPGPRRRMIACGADPMHGTIKSSDEARERAYATPLEDFDVGNPELFRDYTFWPYFERLRKEEPVHYSRGGMFG